MAMTVGYETERPDQARVVIVSASDWEVVYVDGKKVFEHHEMDKTHLLEELGIPWHLSYQGGELFNANYADRGKRNRTFPYKLEDVYFSLEDVERRKLDELAGYLAAAHLPL